MPDIFDIFNLWIPGGEDYTDLIKNLWNCNQAIKQFSEGNIDAETMLDIIENNGINMDEYIIAVNDDLDYIEL